GSRPSRSSRQAPPEIASQPISHSVGWRETNNAIGAATQRLRQLKQSINRPAGLWPSNLRKRKMLSPGPSSLASRWVTRQVARTARASRRIMSTFLCPYSSARGRKGLVAADAEGLLVVLTVPVKQAGSESGPGDERHDVGAVSPTAGVFDDGTEAAPRAYC